MSNENAYREELTESDEFVKKFCDEQLQGLRNHAYANMGLPNKEPLKYHIIEELGKTERRHAQYAKNPPKSFEETADRVIGKMFPDDIEILKYTDINDLIFYNDNLNILVNWTSVITEGNSPIRKMVTELGKYPKEFTIISIMWNKLQQGKTQKLPLKYQKAVKRVLKAISTEEKHKIKNIPEEDLFIHTTENIFLVKKHWGLWEDDGLIYRARYSISVNGIAARVCREVWKELQESKLLYGCE